MNNLDHFSSEIRNKLSDERWLYIEDELLEDKNLAQETLFTLCSGKMSSRGCHIEGQAKPSLPAHYMHRMFDRSEALQRELVNLPDWSKLSIFLLRHPISPQSSENLEGYVRVLDLKKGFLACHYIHTDKGGRRTEVEYIKVLSREYPDCAAIQLSIKALNYDGIIEFENIIDATVTNFMDYPRFRVKHFEVKEIRSLAGNGIAVDACTRDFLEAFSVQTAVLASDEKDNDIQLNRQFKPYGERAVEFFDLKVKMGVEYKVTKYACVRAAHQGFDCRKEASELLNEVRAKGFEYLVSGNEKIYAEMWKTASLSIIGDERAELALRLSIFHLMSTPNPDDTLSNVGAKLLHGEEYGGHAFWDTELFTLPFYTLCLPKIAGNLVRYRYELLPAAINYAKESSYDGARYPWESADTGEEECPLESVLWDGSSEPCVVGEEELHVTSDVVYGAYQYYKWTLDEDYFKNAFLEILWLSTRFWCSRLEWNEKSSSYGLNKIMGPDEWHESISDNAYTLELIRWQMDLAISLYKEYNEKVPKLVSKLKLTASEVDNWIKIKDLIRKPKLNDKGVIEEFDGYFSLKDAEIEEFNEKGMPIYPKSLRDYHFSETTIIKQADVLMLQYLLDDMYDFDSKRVNFDYYQKRTLHGSSLSPSIHCLMGLRSGEKKDAYENFLRSVLIDIDDKHRNTREGYHAAAAGGSWQCVVFGFAGMKINSDRSLSFCPNLPEKWRELRFSFNYYGETLEVHIRDEEVLLYTETDKQIMYKVNGKDFKSRLKI